MKVYNCLHCGQQSIWNRSKSNKFCSNVCQGKYKFQSETLLKFAAGLIENRDTIRKCLIHNIGDYCHTCGITDWNGAAITFQVDHEDGNPGNNKPDNVKLICPNCHSQSPYFGARNKGNGRKFRGLSRR